MKLFSLINYYSSFVTLLFIVISVAKVKNISVKNGDGFYLTQTSEAKITFCSVNTPFDEEELERRTEEEVTSNLTSRILIHDEQNEKNDVTRYCSYLPNCILGTVEGYNIKLMKLTFSFSADNKRLHLTITDNLCQVSISNAMKKDNGKWDLYVGVENDFFQRDHSIFMISVVGKLMQ